MYRAATKYNIGYILEGHSFRTEGVSPIGWLYMDGRYIRSVHQTHGTVKMIMGSANASLAIFAVDDCE